MLVGRGFLVIVFISLERSRVGIAIYRVGRKHDNKNLSNLPYVHQNDKTSRRQYSKATQGTEPITASVDRVARSRSGLFFMGTAVVPILAIMDLFRRGVQGRDRGTSLSVWVGGK